MFVTDSSMKPAVHQMELHVGRRVCWAEGNDRLDIDCRVVSIQLSSAKTSAQMEAAGGQWTSANELPVEIPLPAAYQFHSIFVCPVSKERLLPKAEG